MRILVTGANGQVGHELLRAFESPPLQGEGLGGDGSNFESRPNTIPTPALPLKGRGKSAPARRDVAGEYQIIPATRSGHLDNGTTCECIDLADLDGLRKTLDRIAPDLIVNAAAYTAVDRAEDEAELAQRINGDAVGVLGAWAAARDARVVHYSTDYVFDGCATTPYRETDTTHSLGVYGSSKLAGEIALRESGARHLIFRTAWVYASRGKNFLLTMLRVGAERDELRVVDDQIGAPTPARLIAGVTALAIARWYLPPSKGRGSMRSIGGMPALDGTYNLVASGQTSWCGFARAIFEQATVAGMLARDESHPPRRASRAFAFAPPFLRKGEEIYPLRNEEGHAQRGGMLARAPRVTAITTADYPTKAKRPAYSVLDTSKLRAAFGVELPSWQMALDGVIAELASVNP